MAQTFDLPVDVPWTLVAASPAMMVQTFCPQGGTSLTDDESKLFSPSLAIYAYEPAPGDLPPQLCNQVVTYLKVTASITGLVVPQPIITARNESAAAVLVDLHNDYYACYGVLLNIAVFPSVTTLPVNPPVAEDINFIGAPQFLPDPYTDVTGVKFSLDSGVALRTEVFFELGKPALQVLLVPSGVMTIDMAGVTTTKVVLRMLISNQNSKGNITAYFQGATVFQASIPVAKPDTIQDVAIDTNSPISQIVIDQTAEESFLYAITFETGERIVSLDQYPHIIDFEPKTRDLYQAATDQAEVLTGSSSDVNAGKSLSNTSSSQMGLSLSGGIAYQGVAISAGLTDSWGNTSTNSSTTSIDQSRERRETKGTTTNITQQYNLLTGYHAGTNRAVVLMLPRPHTLQATDFRTFVRGLRVIEGMQDVFLIVSRPTVLPGLCIDVTMDTGHFPESQLPAPLAAPPMVQQSFTFTVGAFAGGGNATGNNWDSQQTLSLPSPWTIDTSKGDTNQDLTITTPGFSWSVVPVKGDTAASAGFQQANRSKRAIITGTAQDAINVSLHINSDNNINAPDAACNFILTVFGVSPQPNPLAGTDPVVVAPFQMQSAELCACIKSCPQTNCIQVIPPQQVPSGQIAPPAAAAGAQPQPQGERVQARRPPRSWDSNKATASLGSIVYETKISLPGHVVANAHPGASRSPAARELLHQIQHHMLTSSRRAERRPRGSVSFYDSDYATERLAGRLSPDELARPLSGVEGLTEDAVNALGPQTTVGEALSLPLHRLSARAEVGIQDTVKIRRVLLGFAGNAGR